MKNLTRWVRARPLTTLGFVLMLGWSVVLFAMGKPVYGAVIALSVVISWMMVVYADKV